MSEFKAGDQVRVRDIGDNQGYESITPGQVYSVLSVSYSMRETFLSLEDGKTGGWYPWRFELVEQAEESNVVDVKVGDFVKLTRKGAPERTVTDYVIGLSKDGDFYTRPDAQGLRLTGGDKDNTHYAYNRWDVEVLKRPYSLPTEPGLYTIAGTNETVHLVRTFRLSEVTRNWSENYKETVGLGTSVVDYLKEREWDLKRLVIEE